MKKTKIKTFKEQFPYGVLDDLKKTKPEIYKQFRSAYHQMYRESQIRYTLDDIRRHRCWVIVGHKKNGDIVGRVENSLSMSWSDNFVRVYRPSTIQLNCEFTVDEYRKVVADYADVLSKHVDELNNMYPDMTVRMYRVGSKKCPIKINWGAFHDKHRKKLHKYRNIEFITK